MVKKKSKRSIFSRLVSKIRDETTSADCQIIDDEFYVGFDTAEQIEQFHSKIIDENPSQIDSNSTEIDMKTFAEQFLIETPSEIEKFCRNIDRKSTFDDDPPTIFDSIEEQIPTNSKRIGFDEIDSILQTLEPKNLSIVVKDEPTELVIDEIIGAKEEPIESNYVVTGPMSFGSENFCGQLDDFVQNIHLSLNEQNSTRPKRIRKRKRFYIEESESIVPKKKTRRKPNSTTRILTDAEIEREFGERLSPKIKSETNEQNFDENLATRRMFIEIEPVVQTPIERARAKLFRALEHADGPDHFLLKLRTRENKFVEIQLAIYGTADWRPNRTKILAKIEEALRGLRVSWTKIDIRVDDFDIEICTLARSVGNSWSLLPNSNYSSWFLKLLSESGPLIVHIHDRRYPQQRFRIRCSCPHCSNAESTNQKASSLPVIVNVSPNKMTTPSILRRTSSKVKLNETKFSKELIHQFGRSTFNAVSQCVHELVLIVTVHKSFDILRKNSSSSIEIYREKFQEILEPSKLMNNERIWFPFTFQQPEIVDFYRRINKYRANIENAEAMKNVINSFPSTIVKTKPSTTLIIPRTSEVFKQPANLTPLIELKSIVSKEISTTTTNFPNNGTRLIRLSIPNQSSSTTVRLVSSNSTVNKSSSVPLIPKQINIIKPLSSSTITANKLTNPILIVNKTREQTLTK